MMRRFPLHSSLLALLVLIAPSAVWALEQGFAVEANSEVELRVNGIVFKGDQLNELFSVERAQRFDKYLARQSAFDGSEDLMLSAYAVDAAGNRSLAPAQLELAAIDTTAPEVPEVNQIQNPLSDRYSNGFTLPSSSVPIIIINGLVVEDDHIANWFDVRRVEGSDHYEPLVGLFDGTERIEVAAYKVDSLGNQSPISNTTALLPIDTLSPGAPRILTLDQLQAGLDSSHATEEPIVTITPSAAVEVLPSERVVEAALQVQPSTVVVPKIEQRSNEETLLEKTFTAVPNPPLEAISDVDDLSANIKPRVATESPAFSSGQEELEALVARILDEPTEFNVQASDRALNEASHITTPKVLEPTKYVEPVQIALEALEPAIISKELSRVEELDQESTESALERREAQEGALTLIQTDVPGDMLAAANGLDPFEVLNLELQTFEVSPEEIAKRIPGKKPQPITRVFDLKTPDDTLRLIDWMRLESTTITCSILETADGGSLHEILACLDRLGYPQAQMVELPEGIRIDTGEKMVIESVGVHSVIDSSLTFSSEFLADLESQPLSKAQHVKAIERLDQLGFVRNSSFDYYARAPGVYDAELVGEAGESQLSLGASLTTAGKLFGALDGRHFFDYQGLRYLDYRVGSDVDGEYEIDLSVPIFYNLDNQLDLEFKTAPSQFRFFDSRTTSMIGRWKDFSGGDSIHLAQVHISTEHHEFSPKSSALISSGSADNQTVFETEAQFDAQPGWTGADGVTLSIGLGHNLERRSSYARADIEYDTGAVHIADTDFALRARVSGSHLAGDRKAVPLDTRLYLGGANTVRGVRSGYIGAAINLDRGGGSSRLSSQIELSRPLEIFDQTVHIGVHLDAGALNGSDLTESKSAVSVGLFGRAQINQNTSAYAYLSRANVDEDERSALGIALVRKF